MLGLDLELTWWMISLSMSTGKSSSRSGPFALSLDFASARLVVFLPILLLLLANNVPAVLMRALSEDSRGGGAPWPSSFWASVGRSGSWS